MTADDVLGSVESDVDAELILARASGSDGSPVVGDENLQFDAASVVAYEVRLGSLRDAAARAEAP